MKGSPYSIAERRVLELIPVLGSQPAGDVNRKPDGRLPLLSARPAVTLTTFKRAATNFAAWWTEARWVWTVCLRLLPDSVAAAIWTRAFLRLRPAREPLGYRATHLTSTWPARRKNYSRPIRRDVLAAVTSLPVRRVAGDVGQWRHTDARLRAASCRDTGSGRRETEVCQWGDLHTHFNHRSRDSAHAQWPRTHFLW